jgi:hypothetical protein
MTGTVIPAKAGIPAGEGRRRGWSAAFAAAPTPAEMPAFAGMTVFHGVRE